MKQSTATGRCIKVSQSSVVRLPDKYSKGVIIMAHAAVRITGESLGFVDLFSNLDLAARQRIARVCRGRRYHVGQVVVSQNNASRDVFFVISGNLRVTIFSLTGKTNHFPR